MLIKESSCATKNLAEKLAKKLIVFPATIAQYTENLRKKLLIQSSEIKLSKRCKLERNGAFFEIANLQQEQNCYLFYDLYEIERIL